MSGDTNIPKVNVPRTNVSSQENNSINLNKFLPSQDNSVFIKEFEDSVNNEFGKKPSELPQWMQDAADVGKKIIVNGESSVGIGINFEF